MICLAVLYKPYSTWGLWDSTHMGRADSASPPPCNTAILKDMDLKFGMLQ